MNQTLKATYSDGVFKPSVLVDLDDGTEVTISVSEALGPQTNSETLASTAGAWKDTVDCDKLLRDIYASRAEISDREMIL